MIRVRNPPSIEPALNVEPLVTIAIPTRDRVAYLEQTLRSALAQDHAALEVIVGDNASTDGTQDLLAGLDDERLVVLRHEENLGMAGNWNACLAAARGDWFLLLSDDDLIDPDFLSYCLSAVGEGPPPGVVRTATRVIDEHGELLGLAPNVGGELDEADYYLAWFADRTGHFLCSTLHRTEALRGAGGFASPRNLMLDVRMGFLLGHRHGRVDLPADKAAYRKHESSVSAGARLRDWLEDGLDVVSLVQELVPERARELREAGLAWAARRNYVRASDILSAPERLSAILHVWRRCGLAHPPWPGAFVSPRSRWGRRLRELKRSLTARGAR